MVKNSNDLTSLTDISEFLHSEDAKTEQKLKELSGLPQGLPEIPLEEELLDVSTPQAEETLPDLPFEESAPLENSFDESSELSTNDQEENFDSTLVADISFDAPLESLDDFPSEITPEIALEVLESIPAEILEEIPDEIQNEIPEEVPEVILEEYKAPEDFKEVKTFAQNFSHSELPSGGNPPFSIIVKNITLKEEADDILALLREYKIATKENENELIRSLDLGTILIPQINEYLAILLTHKLRRYNFDIEMGLSDQIQPPKDEDYNPRGLTSKLNLKQNRSENFVFKKDQVPYTDILASTTPTLVGYKITKYHGVETSFRIVESDDLERLHFIQHTMTQALDTLDDETKNDYSNFKGNFHQIYNELLNEIREHAFLKNANALLGVSFSLTPLLNVLNQNQNKYQLICSATLASVLAEMTTENT